MKIGFFDFNNFSLTFKTTSSDTEGSIIFTFGDEFASLNKDRISSGSDITTGPGLPLFAILNALETPRDINFNLVNAQQARRVLDRLVGYELSPVLWRKVKAGLSAGRVQSVSVRLIVEKEREIKNFISKSSYKLIGVFENEQGVKLKAELNIKYYSVEEVKNFLKKNHNSIFDISSIDKKPAKKSPTPPFTTSTLQQEASRKLGFGVTRTMSTAQKLYEAGLITYMRTDSVTISNEAKSSIVQKIESKYGEDYVNLRDYKNKNKSAQEAHEAVRPTDINIEEITSDYDQQRLYHLIWKRTISSQMSDAQIERTVVNIKSDSYNEFFVARGEVIKFDGFLRVYNEGTDDEIEEEKGVLPALSINENLNLLRISSRESFSRPTSRFTEASLVKKLEELGIGRPATYATTISTIQNRGYIARGVNEGLDRNYNLIEFSKNGIKESQLKEKTGSNKGKLVPTDIGMIVNDFLVDNFNNILETIAFSKKSEALPFTVFKVTSLGVFSLFEKKYLNMLIPLIAIIFFKENLPLIWFSESERLVASLIPFPK